MKCCRCFDVDILLIAKNEQYDEAAGSTISAPCLIQQYWVNMLTLVDWFPFIFT